MPDQLSRHLSRKAYERNAVIIRSSDACHKIRGARSACHKADTNSTRRTRVTVRRMDQTLLMARQDHVYFLFSIKRVKQIDHLSSRISEQRVNPFFFQRFHK